MNRYNYYSEQAAVSQELMFFFQKHGEAILKFYLKRGFQVLVESLKLQFDWQRTLLFNFLVFEKKAILECIKINKIYFIKIISDQKGDQIRNILGITDVKYDSVWKEALEVLNLYYIEKLVENEQFEKACELFFQFSFNRLERKNRNTD